MKRSYRRILAALTVSCLSLVLASQLFAENQSPNAGETLKWQVVAGGGTTNGTSAGFKLSSTVGQTAAGFGSSPGYKLNQGFQQSFTSAAPCLCGDANNTGSINISDAVYVINYIFGGGSAPNPICLGDANGTGNVNISDAVYIISFIFGGGPAPHCP